MTPEGHALIAIGIVFPILLTFIVAGRFRARHLMRISLQMDDWFTLLSLFSVYIMNFTMVYGAVDAGYGLPPAEIYPDGPWVKYGKVYFVEKLTWEFTIAILKIAALLLYRRVFISNKFKRPIDVLIAVNAIWMVGNMISTICAFSPVDAFWNGNGKPRIAFGYFLLTVDTTDIILDLATLLFPLFAIGTLQMSLKRKVAISCVFLTGLLSTIASAVRLPLRVHILDADRAISPTQPLISIEHDTVALFFIWTLLEVNLALAAICLPTLGPTLVECRNWAVHGSSSGSTTTRTRTMTMTSKAHHGGHYHSSSSASILESRRFGEGARGARPWMELESGPVPVVGNRVDVERGSVKGGSVKGGSVKGGSVNGDVLDTRYGGVGRGRDAERGIRVKTTFAITHDT